ncbi:MAG: hypothetical protein ACFE9R_14630 [Candidatus Hermodarchaeota archaeon]
MVNFQVVEGPQGPPGQDGDEGPPGSLGILVGLWEELYTNRDYAPYNTAEDWLVQVDDVQVNNSNYFSLSRNRTRFHLNENGCYRINIHLLIFCSPGYIFAMWVYKNDVLLSLTDWIESTDMYAHLGASTYLWSNGTDYYDFVVNGNDVSDLVTDQRWHQFAIEYIGEY